MLDLAKIFQFIEDGFNYRQPLEECLVEWRILDGLHVLAHLVDEIHLTCTQEVDQPTGDLSLIGIHPAKQPATQKCNRFTIIDGAWRDFDAQQFAIVVNGYIKFQPIDPSSRALAARSDLGKDPLLEDAQVIAYSKPARIDNGNAGTTAIQVYEQGN